MKQFVAWMYGRITPWVAFDIGMEWFNLISAAFHYVQGQYDLVMEDITLLAFWMFLRFRDQRAA
jgi:hypothetical protein